MSAGRDEQRSTEVTVGAGDFGFFVKVRYPDCRVEVES
jgi:hypothetical protein